MSGGESELQHEWWRGAVIYQIYPRSFQDSDGDGIGDIAGIIERLPHVAALGVDAIWLSPVFTSPMLDMGYDVSDYTDIDPVFGDLAAFDKLVARAHTLGLKVIIDQVLSHTSDKHSWFAQSRSARTGPRADWYVWADPLPDGAPPNNWPSVFGGIAWEWEPRRRQYYLHNFLPQQPDLNYHCAAVQDAALDVMRFWLDRGVDGFRLDTVNYYIHDAKLRSNPAAPREVAQAAHKPYGMQDHIHSKNQPQTLAFIERMRALTDSYEARAMVGEIGEEGPKGAAIMAEYTRGGKRLHMAYSFDMLGAGFSAAGFRRKIESFQTAAPDGWPCWSFSNHDVVRHVSRWAAHGQSPEALAKLCIAMLASFEGTIGIFQGEELGQLETEMDYHELTDCEGLSFWPELKGRDGCRTPMVWDAALPHAGFSAAEKTWLPIKPPQAARAVAGQEADPGSVLHHYRDVLAFRCDAAPLRAGRTRFLDLGEPILAFRREAGAETLLCVFNLSAEPLWLAASGDLRLTGPHHGSLAAGRLDLPPNGFAWLNGPGDIAAPRPGP